ncbi:MAG: VOC family protein [Vulcanimicrobiaceae bacterium]
MAKRDAMIPFHLSFPVRDLASTRAFYGDLLACPAGRETEDWIDYDFFGHQLSAHVALEASEPAAHCDMDGKRVPLRHFGAVLPWNRWEALALRLRDAGCPFSVEPHVRFAGEPGEQGTFFIADPSGNALEFKTYRHPAGVFAVA